MNEVKPLSEAEIQAEKKFLNGLRNITELSKPAQMLQRALATIDALESELSTLRAGLRLTEDEQKRILHIQQTYCKTDITWLCSIITRLTSPVTQESPEPGMTGAQVEQLKEFIHTKFEENLQLYKENDQNIRNRNISYGKYSAFAAVSRELAALMGVEVGE